MNRSVRRHIWTILDSPIQTGRTLAAGLVWRLWLLPAALGLSLASGAELPPPWKHQPLNASKPLTQYQLAGVSDGPLDPPLLHARAHRSASLVVQRTPVDLNLHPWVHWRWQIRAQPQQPDIAVAAREDAAARLVFFFDGDHTQLPWTDRVVLAAARRLGSRPLPYATLMYVSAPGKTEGEVIANPYTRRIQMLVVDAELEPGNARWRQFSRDLHADYRRVFGTSPGTLLGWGVMTDSDNTRSQAEAVYGPVRWSTGP